MAVYRQVQTAFWQDDFVLQLTPEEKYFYLYLLTKQQDEAVRDISTANAGDNNGDRL